MKNVRLPQRKLFGMSFSFFLVSMLAPGLRLVAAATCESLADLKLAEYNDHDGPNSGRRRVHSACVRSRNANPGVLQENCPHSAG